LSVLDVSVIQKDEGLGLRFAKLLRWSNIGHDHTARRSYLLKLAMTSSGISKVTAAALQGLAIPLVFHALGAHQYALYLLLTAALATIALMDMGAGPGLSQAVAKAHADGDRGAEAGVLVSALTFVSMAALLGGIAISAVVRIVPPERLFGSNFSADQTEIIAVTNVCVLVMIANVTLSVVDSALAGYLEQVASNIGNCIANLISTVLLVVICHKGHPSITQVLLVLYGVVGLSRIINLAALIYRRPYLLSGYMHVNSTAWRALMSTGTAFWLIQTFCMIEQYGGTYVMAHLTTVRATDTFGLIYRAISLAASAVGIFTQPLWPALTDALSRRDFSWIQRVSRKTRASLMLIAGSLSLVFATAGTAGVEYLWHVDISADKTQIYVLAVYLFVNIWTHYHYIMLEGLDRVWIVAGLILLENCAMVAFGAALVPRWGGVGMAAGYLLASLALPAWILPRILKVRFLDLKVHTSQILSLQRK
jgi:O-antigen/teichoic acid export membrane protein